MAEQATAKKTKRKRRISGADGVWGPYELQPWVRDLVCVAASEPSRYTLNRIALYNHVPALAATDGRIGLVVPLRSIDTLGKPLDRMPPASTREVLGDPTWLLPLALFSHVPRRLSDKENHLELTLRTVEGQEGVLDATIMEKPTGFTCTHRYDGCQPDNWPQLGAVLREPADDDAVVALDTSYLKAIVRACGSSVVELRVRQPGHGVAIEARGEPVTMAFGVIMPVTLTEPGSA